jgi:hypothetical protein
MISYPWPTVDIPQVMTSWGKIQKFDQFDAGLAKNFVLTSRNRHRNPMRHKDLSRL